MLRVLIADDEFDACENMIATIRWEEHGMEIAAAVNNGTAAYEFIVNNPVDIVLIDIQMQGANGLDVIERVRAANCQQPVFIIISGYDDFSYMQRAIRLKVDGYLLKPFRSQDVLSILKEHFGDTSATRSINDYVPGFGELMKEVERSGQAPFVYPTQREMAVIAAISSGSDAEVRAAIDDFSRAIDGFATSAGLNCYVILYAEIYRCFGSHAAVPAGSIAWDQSAPAKSLCRLLTSIALEARHSLDDENVHESVPAVRARAYIDKNYAAHLTLSSVAEAVSVSPTYLSTCFVRDMGIGFVDYIKNVRVQHARRMLSEHEKMSIDDIAVACGYPDTKYFKQVFKQVTGLSPYAYRKQILLREQDGN